MPPPSPSESEKCPESAIGWGTASRCETACYAVFGGVADEEQLQKMIKLNVLAQIEHIKTHPSMRDRLLTAKLKFVAGSTTSATVLYARPIRPENSRALAQTPLILPRESPHCAPSRCRSSACVKNTPCPPPQYPAATVARYLPADTTSSAWRSLAIRTCGPPSVHER